MGKGKRGGKRYAIKSWYLSLGNHPGGKKYGVKQRGARHKMPLAGFSSMTGKIPKTEKTRDKEKQPPARDPFSRTIEKSRKQCQGKKV